jgi:hypothetical protein
MHKPWVFGSVTSLICLGFSVVACSGTGSELPTGNESKAGQGGSQSGGGQAGGNSGNSGQGGQNGSSGQGGSAGSSGMGGMCDASHAECDGDPASVCETDVANSIQHCGDCTTVCQTGPHGTAVCQQLKCELTCESGYTSCDKNNSTGCETNTFSDPNNCGTCGKKCEGHPNADPSCNQGNCSYSCQTGFDDCDLMPANGCETNIDQDPNNCGMCNKVCENGGECLQGACQCAGETQSAKQIPLDMYIMLDKSFSMSGTRWNSVTAALQSFFTSVEAKGIGAGIQYYPQEGGDECLLNNYNIPAIGIAPLPGNATGQAAFLSGTNGCPGGGIMCQVPDGNNTPTLPALQGALQYARNWKTSFNDHEVIVVLVTDGSPNGCSSTAASVQAEAMAGFTSSPSVPTYVIGLDDNGTLTANLNSWADAGGSNKAFFVNTGDPMAFLNAMKSIQSAALGCDFSLPEPPPGETLDTSKVNINYTPGTGASQSLVNYDNEAACANNDGWYYDNNTSPTLIHLCPNTCTTVKSDIQAQVQVVVGCTTIKP